MKKIYLEYVALSLIFLVWFSCQDERMVYSDDSSPAPGQVTINDVILRPGGAVIKYSVPNDKNLLAVKAVYERNGEICETKASLYSDSLTIEGFGDTESHKVEIYSIGRNGKLSAPIDEMITPLMPPVFSTTIDISATFGGVNVVFSNNISNANLALVLMADTTGTGNGELIPLQTFYTQAASGRFSRRDLESKQQVFALYIRDRWQNISDTIYKTLTPTEEIKLPKDTWTNARLPGDSYNPASGQAGWQLPSLWDGRETWNVAGSSGFFATTTTEPIPQRFTISLGYKASFSRFKMWPRSSEVYNGSAPRTWEIWGSEDPPGDGSWDNWYLLGEFSQVKPSGYGEGSAVGNITAEDLEHWQSGGDYEFTVTDNVPDPQRATKFLRFKTTATFTTYGTNMTTGQLIIGEITLWGKKFDE
ncbi:MAG: DUF4959 domain-containing protein [Prevotellaceae bacterium]|jgi:hypothetical protein|nr:DUF4959 domain-containing protein [Prevotellaceae bacterium]